MSVTTLSANARALATEPDLRPLWQAVHDRLCSGADPASLARVTVAVLGAAGVAQLRGWLDDTARRRRGASAVAVTDAGVRVPLRELLQRFTVPAEQLPALVHLAVGRPVVDRAQLRRTGLSVREQLWADVDDQLVMVPGLARQIRLAGVSDVDVGVVRAQARVLGAALRALPGPKGRPVTLPKLAHDCAGDPHAFDLDTLTGRRLVDAVAELQGALVPSRPDAVRALLATVGVLADRLSATVLLLNVRAVGRGPVDCRLQIGGGPVPLTLYDLTVQPPDLAAEPLLVVENPSVLEAAMAAGFEGALACTSGHLRAVDHALLQRAVDCNVPLAYAGDLDPDGLAIAGQVQRLYGARLVGMDFEVAVPPDTTVPSPASGDSATAPFMVAHGRVLFQEHDAVLTALLGRGVDDPTGGAGIGRRSG